MHNITFLKFSSEILECDEDQVVNLLYDSSDNRWKISSELKKVEKKAQGVLVALVGPPGNNGITTPITGIGERLLVKDKPTEAIKPLNMESNWWAAYCAHAKEALSSLSSGEEMKDIIAGPGILLEHPWRENEEFYPINSNH